MNIKSILIALSLVSISLVSNAGVTWTKSEIPSQVYLTQGCQGTLGETIVVVTVPSETKQFIFKMTDPGAEYFFEIAKTAVSTNKKIQINYNYSSDQINYEVVRGSDCGRTNTMIEILGISLDN
ncbi:MAG: hypothetical protein HRU38_22340 [Saccharospirillaceae bacterium]|nr:hypothetical protein [Pseudomonadales bacterium]NRB81367.1 hypothetical protein [Saccharospirillaceae bacterium]